MAKELVFKLQMDLVRGSVNKMGQILGGKREDAVMHHYDTPRKSQEELEAIVQEQKDMIKVFLEDILRHNNAIKDMQNKLSQRVSAQFFVQLLHPPTPPPPCVQ